MWHLRIIYNYWGVVSVIAPEVLRERSFFRYLPPQRAKIRAKTKPDGKCTHRQTRR